MEASNNIIISIWIEYESMDKYKCISTIATTIWEWSEMRTMMVMKMHWLMMMVLMP
jgi:hypothetical protein